MSSKEILLRDGSKYFLNSVTAEVVSDPNIWSETHVHSTGGGGFVHPTYGGHVSSPQVHSTVKERQSYFVKTEQGKEIELRDAVTARKGHNIRIIYGKREQEETRMVATENDITSNYSLKKPRYFGKYFSLFSCMPFKSFSNLYKSLIFLISFVLLSLLHLIFLLFPVGLLLLILPIVERTKRIKHLDGEIVSFINNL